MKKKIQSCPFLKLVVNKASLSPINVNLSLCADNPYATYICNCCLKNRFEAFRRQIPTPSFLLKC